MKTLMLAVVACSTMMMTACGDDKIENEQNNMASATSENADTQGEEATEENDSTDVNEVEDWNKEELDDIIITIGSQTDDD